MDLLTWLIVGLIAGVLASFVMGGIGYGLIGDIIVGVVGAGHREGFGQRCGD